MSQRLARGILKQAAISCRVYGPLRRAYRRWARDAYTEHFRHEVAFYRQFLSPGDLCFDVGANIGAKTEVFLALGARVVAFEPQPHCFREMMARCGPHPHLTGVSAAVGAASGNVPMYVNRNSAASSLLRDWNTSHEKTIPIRVTTLDHEIRQYGPPGFCKIDVEGYELEVLRGLSRPLPLLSLEYHLDAKDTQKVLDCAAYLSTLGRKLEMNITLGEEMEFTWPTWIGYDSFRESFPARVPRTETCGYGDLFIRTL